MTAGPGAGAPAGGRGGGPGGAPAAAGPAGVRHGPLRGIVRRPTESRRYGTCWYYLVALEARKGAGTRDPHFVAVLFGDKVVPGVRLRC